MVIELLCRRRALILDDTTQDESSGMKIIDILMKTLYKMDDDYLIALQ